MKTNFLFILLSVFTISSCDDSLSKLSRAEILDNEYREELKRLKDTTQLFEQFLEEGVKYSKAPLKMLYIPKVIAALLSVMDTASSINREMLSILNQIQQASTPEIRFKEDILLRRSRGLLFNNEKIKFIRKYFLDKFMGDFGALKIDLDNFDQENKHLLERVQQ